VCGQRERGKAEGGRRKAEGGRRKAEGGRRKADQSGSQEARKRGGQAVGSVAAAWRQGRRDYEQEHE